MIASMCVCKCIHRLTPFFFFIFLFSFFCELRVHILREQGLASLCVADNKIIEQRRCMNRWRREKDVGKKKKNKGRV